MRLKTQRAFEKACDEETFIVTVLIYGKFTGLLSESIFVQYFQGLRVNETSKIKATLIPSPFTFMVGYMLTNSPVHDISQNDFFVKTRG